MADDKNDNEMDVRIMVSIKLVNPATGKTVKETSTMSEETVKTLTYDDLGDLGKFLDKFDDFEKATLETVAKAEKQIAGGYSQPVEKKRRGQDS